MPGAPFGTIRYRARHPQRPKHLTPLERKASDSLVQSAPLMGAAYQTLCHLCIATDASKQRAIIFS
jgi:hypothetical protein